MLMFLTREEAYVDHVCIRPDTLIYLTQNVAGICLSCQLRKRSRFPDRLSSLPQVLEDPARLPSAVIVT